MRRGGGYNNFNMRHISIVVLNKAQRQVAIDHSQYIVVLSL